MNFLFCFILMSLNLFDYNHFCVGLKVPSYQYGEDDGEEPAVVGNNAEDGNPSSGNYGFKSAATDKDDTQYTAGIQFMITRRMRRTLEDELGYTDTEVDNMEPQIAAVVIDRKLSRPLNGMPNSWRKSYVAPETGVFMKLKKFNTKTLRPAVENVINTTKKYSPYILSTIVLSIIAPQSSNIAQWFAGKINGIKLSNIFKLNILSSLNLFNRNANLSQQPKENNKGTVDKRKALSSETPNSLLKSNVKMDAKQQSNVNKSNFPLKNDQSVLPSQIKLSSKMNIKNQQKVSIDKLSFDKATKLSFFDRFVIIKHIFIGK